MTIEHTGPISGVDARGGLVATAGYDNRVLLWDLEERRAVARGWHDHLANQCRFSADGHHLVSASSDFTARVWSVPDLRLEAVLAGHDDDVEMAAYSPDDRWIATASRDHTARVFDRHGRMQSVLHGHDRAVLSVEWSTCGTQVTTSSDDGTIRTWQAATGRELSCEDLGGSETDTICRTPDGMLIAGNDEGTVAFGVGSQRRSEHHGHAAGVKRIAVSPSGRLAASAGYDHRLVVWAITQHGLEPGARIAIPAIVWARSMAWVDDERLVFGTFGTSFAVLELRTQQWHIDHIGPTGGLNALAHHDGALRTIGDAGRLHTIDTTGAIRPTDLGSLCNLLVPWGDTVVTGGHLGVLYDSMTGEPLVRHDAPLNCAAALPDGRLVVGTYTGEGLVLQRSDGRAAPTIERVQLGGQAIKGVAASNDTLFAIDAAGRARTFSLPDLGVRFDLPGAHDSIANSVCTLPDGRFATVGRDGQLRLWDGERAERHRAPLQHSLKCVAAGESPHLVVGAYDGSIAVFRFDTNEWVAHRRVTTSGISDVVARPGGGFAATAYDGTVLEVTPELSLVAPPWRPA